ncbi:MAG: hydantoinase/oxoprolinase family protein, partial [Myxococcota bacterium]
IGGATVVAPAMAVESVAAGGGSICRFDGYRLRVGPESAGADPGPACYGAGGPLTVTDVNLLLGRLQPAGFEIPIDLRAARSALQGVLSRLDDARAPDTNETRLLEGFLQIATERMADAVRRISLRKGYDPSEHALVAFGGAGGQFACALASLLDIATVIVPRDAGLLSAVGLGHARIERFVQRQLLAPLTEARPNLKRWRDELVAKAEAELKTEGLNPTATRTQRALVHMRFRGQDATIAVELDDVDDVERDFLERYTLQYGYRPDTADIEAESLRVVVSAHTPPPPVELVHEGSREAAPAATQRALFDGQFREVPVFLRTALDRGTTLLGPALILEEHGTTVLEPGWTLTCHPHGAMILQREAA